MKYVKSDKIRILKIMPSLQVSLHLNYLCCRFHRPGQLIMALFLSHHRWSPKGHPEWQLVLISFAQQAILYHWTLFLPQSQRLQWLQLQPQPQWYSRLLVNRHLLHRRLLQFKAQVGLHLQWHLDQLPLPLDCRQTKPHRLQQVLQYHLGSQVLVLHFQVHQLSLQQLLLCPRRFLPRLHRCDIQQLWK